MKCRKNVGFVLIALVLGSFLALQIIFRDRFYFYLISTSFASFIMLIEVVILIFMKCKTNRLGCFKLLQSTINNIYAQFGVFVGVYFVIIAFNSLKMITKKMVDNKDEIGLGILNLTIKHFFFQIPIIYIIYAHQISLSKDSKQDDEST